MMRTPTSFYSLLLLAVLNSVPSIECHPGIEDHEHEGPQDNTLLSTQWRSIYSPAQLKLQLPWVLADDQPADGSYETRVYKKHWQVRHHIPCQSQDKASATGYMALYMYMLGANYQEYEYSLTYPIIMSVDHRVKPPPSPKRSKKIKGKRRGKPVKTCPVKYTYIFYVPIPLKKWPGKPMDRALSTQRAAEETFFVRQYASNYTGAYCNEQAAALSTSLSQNNRTFIEDMWYCAQYEVGQIGEQKEQRYEVWIKHGLD